MGCDDRRLRRDLARDVVAIEVDGTEVDIAADAGADAVLGSDGNAPNDVALRDPADIVKAALEGHDVAARRALARFCAVLGSVCGDAALIHGARTVMIAGGMAPRFIPFLRSSAFRERFLAKGRGNRISKPTCHVYVTVGN